MVVAIFGFPRLAMRNQPKLSGEQISRLRPHLRALKYIYNIPQFLGVTVYLVLLVYAGSPFDKPFINEAFLFFAALLYMAIYDGVFALITGVFPATTRWNLNQFIDDPQQKYRRLAQLQIILSILATIAFLAMFMFYQG